jgi:hypothetical protein
MRTGPKLAWIAVTLGAAGFVAAGLPGVRDIPGWFYRPGVRGLGEAWAVCILLLAVPALLGAVFALARRGRMGAAGAVLFAAGIVTQLAMIPADARGLDRVWTRLHVGHGEFLRVAHERRPELGQTLRHYESLVREGELGAFAPSKPPGAIAVYAGMDAMAHGQPLRSWLEPLARDARSHDELARIAPTAALAAWLMPVGQALVLPLVLWLGVRAFGDRRTAVGAAVLCLPLPALALISHHLDGALYPALAVASCALVACGMRQRGRGRGLHALAAGLLLGAGLYVSFSLLVALPLAAGTALVAGRTLDLQRARHWRRAALQWAGLVLGVGVVQGALHLALDYRPLVRFGRALAYHAQWKSSVPTLAWRGWALVEFSLYLGVPLAAAFLWASGSQLRRWVRRRPDPGAVAGPGVAVLLFVLAAAAGTNEVARIWMLLMPLLVLPVAWELPRLARNGQWTRPVAWMAGCQALLTLVMEANQPW